MARCSACGSPVMEGAPTLAGRTRLMVPASVARRDAIADRFSCPATGGRTDHVLILPTRWGVARQ